MGNFKKLSISFEFLDKKKAVKCTRLNSEYRAFTLCTAVMSSFVHSAFIKTYNYISKRRYKSLSFAESNFDGFHISQKMA